MRPLLFPSSIFFIWITFLLSVNIIPTFVFADYSKYKNCKNSFSCGGISFEFPFWGGSRADYCGSPELNLSCNGNVTRFSIDSVPYRILNFDSSAQNLTVARDDYYNNLCPSEFENTTFDPIMFQYYNSDIENLTLFYGCSSSVSGLLSQSCGSVGGNVYYDDKIQYIVVCRNLVVIPVSVTFMRPLFDHSNYNGALQEALNNGFSLQLVLDSEKCNACVDSDGQCGYLSGKFACFCHDGGHSTSCSDGNIIDRDRQLSNFRWNFKNAKFSLAFFLPLVSFVAIVIIICTVIWRKVTETQEVIGRRAAEAWQATRRKATENDQHIVEFIRKQEALATKTYSFSDVKKMTNTFADKVGQGGYGSVYRGKLSDDRHVAVKLLSESRENGEEFLNEVASISRTSHINVVRLLGFCYEGSKRALIYEFMSNGSLDKFIYNRGTSNIKNNLEWKTLYEIAVGIARGLEYLHRGCNMRILHFDIKPHNILLDDEFCPKISDFGLAKLCNRNKSAISMLGARGTIGYIAPEVFSRNFGRVSYKSDVYSYGMMVFEMVGARNGTNFGVSHTSSEVYFPNHIYKSLEAGHALKVDGVTNEEEEKIFRKMALVSLWCIQTNPSDRPSMTKVLEMLEGSLLSLPFPPLPFLSSPPKSPLRSDESYSTRS